MSLGVALMWPAVTLSAFLALTGVVIALGASSTARYEFDRNRARDQRQPTGPRGASAHPAGRGSASRSGEVADGGAPRTAQAVDTAIRPLEAAEATDGPGWWLVTDRGARVVAGPFHDRVDADWAALASDLTAEAMYGVRRADGGVKRRTSPEERAWLTELGDQLDRLPEDWDAVISDTDPLTTLVVEVTAALVEAGLPLHDATGHSPSGGVCLLPDPEHGTVLVGWRSHDRMSVRQVRGSGADAAVRVVMNAAVADVLEEIGFVLQPFGEAGCHLVTAIRP